MKGGRSQDTLNALFFAPVVHSKERSHFSFNSRQFHVQSANYCCIIVVSILFFAFDWSKAAISVSVVLWKLGLAKIRKLTESFCASEAHEPCFWAILLWANSFHFEMKQT